MDGQRKMEWWQRGWWDGSRGDAPKPPQEAAMQEAYRIGYATGQDARPSVSAAKTAAKAASR